MTKIHFKTSLSSNCLGHKLILFSIVKSATSI
uniref:Uncharacterized protein n=1 Tax=Anguilla anguilla TaxID=7936 RepID=A0A0E9TL90_ANGAN